MNESRVQDRLITDKLEHWAQTSPDVAAVDYEDQSFTWKQWRDRVCRVSGGLRASGIGPGDRVATLDKNSLPCLEVTLGAAALGAAHVVINWRLLADQLAYVLNDSQPSVVFVGPEMRAAYDEIADRLSRAPRVILVGGEDDGYESWIQESDRAEPRDDVAADDTALVLYSSGTTGFPKGVELTHRGLNAHSAAIGERLELSPEAVSLVAMPMFHVGGTSYALSGVFKGVRSVVLREPLPEKLVPALGSGTTHAFLVPAVVGALLAAGDQVIAQVAKLRFLIYGASPMPLPMLQQALEVFPETKLAQVYGATELAGVITVLDPDAHRDDAHPERLTSAGTVLAGTQMRIVDPVTERDVPQGEVGEPWFLSEQVMAGYLHRPEDTAKAKRSDGWFRTGDLGYADPGGFLFVMDRIKDLIISGGENIYSPEVENVLAAHPAVAEVAVIGVPDERWGEVVRAVVSLSPGQSLTPEELIDFARERLAHYKCPASVDILEALPRNPSGKILKRDLRQPHWDGRERSI